MRSVQCKGCPNLISHIAARRELTNMGKPMPEEWARVEYYCKNNGIKPLNHIPYCDLSNNGKGGVRIYRRY